MDPILEQFYHLKEYFPFSIASSNWRGVSTSITFLSFSGSTTYHVPFLCFQTAFSVVPPVVDNGITLIGSLRALGDQSKRKLSPKHIKDQIEPVIAFWLDFFEYASHYLAYLNTIGRITKNDPELSKLDQQESVQYDTKANNFIEDLTSTHRQETLNHTSSKKDNGPGPESKETKSGFGFQKVPRVSKEIILVRHPNLNYKKEMSEFRKGLRKEKPKRKTSSCYFDPWKQLPEVLGALIKKGKIRL